MPADFQFESVLTNNGLETYVPMFKHHAISNDVLSNLTPEDLIEVGVTSLGHRIKILKLINDLCDNRRPPGKFTRPSTPHQQGIPMDPFHSFTQNKNIIAHNSGREIALLKQKLEVSERQIRKLNESVARLRADIFRKIKECEPLPNPMARLTSPTSLVPPNSASTTGSWSNPATASTISSSSSQLLGSGPFPTKGNHSSSHLPSTASHYSYVPQSAGSASSSKRSPQDSYFNHPSVSHSTSQLVSSAGSSSLPSPGTFKRANSTSHLINTNNSGSSEPVSAVESTHSVHSNQLNSNVMISQNGTMSLFKKMRCAESDTAAKLVNHFIERYPIKGDPSQWRLAIIYDYVQGDEKKMKSRELLDHEFPLQISKQLEKQGLQPMFHLKQIMPSKLPSGSYI